MLEDIEPADISATVNRVRHSCGNNAVDKYRSPRSGNTTTISFPAFSGRIATFTAAADRPDHVYRAQVEIARGIDDTQSAYDACRRGEPAPEWCEVYFQTAYDPSVAPPGAETMSVFAQYAPYSLADGTWDTRRDEIGDRVLEAIAHFAPDVADCVVEREVLGPPDVEARVGLTGGHIFQGECLPDQMWDRRFASRTPVAGLYLCGAGTHPGGSVIAANGRNAAMAVLKTVSRS